MSNLFDQSGNPIRKPDPKKSRFKNLFSGFNKGLKKHFWTIPATVIAVLAFFGVKSYTDLSFFTSAKAEINFTEDPGYKILLLPFQPLENCQFQETHLERAIQERLLEMSKQKKLSLQVILDTTQACPQNFEDARKIGDKKGANLVIWGDLYESCFKENQACLKYVVVQKAHEEIKKQGQSETKMISNLSMVRQGGDLQQDVDYIIYWTLGMGAINEGNCGQAKLYFDYIFQYFPDKSINCHIELGYCHYLQNQLELSENHYTTALTLNPHSEKVYIDRGKAKLQNGDHNGAISDFTKVIGLNPKYADAYYNRGNAKYKLQDHEGAIEDYGKAIEIDPDDINARKQLEITQEKLEEKGLPWYKTLF